MFDCEQFRNENSSFDNKSHRPEVGQRGPEALSKSSIAEQRKNKTMKAQEFRNLCNLNIIPTYLLDGWSKGKVHEPFDDMIEKTDTQYLINASITVWISSVALVMMLLTGVLFQDPNKVNASIFLFLMGLFITVPFVTERLLIKTIKKRRILEADPKAIWNQLDEIFSILKIQRITLYSASSHEIIDRAKKILIHQAGLVKYAQEYYGLDSPAFHATRKEFGKKHELFLDFRLVEKNWKVYFDFDPAKAIATIDDIKKMEELNKVSPAEI